MHNKPFRWLLAQYYPVSFATEQGFGLVLSDRILDTLAIMLPWLSSKDLKFAIFHCSRKLVVEEYKGLLPWEFAS